VESIPQNAKYNIGVVVDTHVFAVFEPVDVQNPVFTFDSCFTEEKTNAAQLRVLSENDDAELLERLKPLMRFPLGKQVPASKIIRAIGESSNLIEGAYNVILHNCASRVIDVLLRLEAFPSNVASQEFKDLVEFMAINLYNHGFAGFVRSDPIAISTLYSGTIKMPEEGSAIEQDKQLLRDLVHFTIMAQEDCGNGRVDIGEDCDLGDANGLEGASCDSSCSLVGDWYCPGPFFTPAIDRGYQCEFVRDEKSMAMFSLPETENLKNYDEAVSFCASKGLVLGAKEDYCSNEGTPFGGVKLGQDIWAPISDYRNGWVQLGIEPHTPCLTHREYSNNQGEYVNVDPVWGLDGSVRNQYENAYVLCKMPDSSARFYCEEAERTAGLTMFGLEDTKDLKTYNEAVSFCEGKGLEVGSKDDYCGATGTPFGGFRSGDFWSPISDHFNGWVQLGNEQHSPCVTQRDIGEGEDGPAWGTDESYREPVQNVFVLCKERHVGSSLLSNQSGGIRGSFSPSHTCSEGDGTSSFSRQCAGRSNGYTAPAVCLYKPCSFANGFLEVESTRCSSKPVAGCDGSCAKAKCLAGGGYFFEKSSQGGEEDLPYHCVMNVCPFSEGMPMFHHVEVTERTCESVGRETCDAACHKTICEVQHGGNYSDPFKCSFP
jgi:hypothetical protein